MRRHLVWGLGAFLLLVTLEGCGLSALIGTGVALSLGGGSSSGGVPAPTVTTVSPTAGSHQGGTTLTVTGANFPPDATLSVGGIAAANVVVANQGQLQATTPRSTTIGAVDVTVTNPHGGTGTLSRSFTYTAALPAATIANVPSPQSQNVVFSVTVTQPESDFCDLVFELDRGSGFQTIPQGQFVSGNLNQVPSSPQGVVTNVTWDSRQSFPAENAANLKVRVTPIDTVSNQSGTKAVSNAFSIVNNTPPTIQIVQPTKSAFDIAVNFIVADTDGDALSVTALTWRNVQTGASGPLTVKSGQGVGPCPASTTGANVLTVWSSLADLGFGNNQLVTLSISVSDGLTTVTATTLPFFVSNGPLSDETTYSQLGRDPQGFAVGDITGDGLPDIVCFRGSSLTVNVNRGQTFDTANIFGSPNNPGILASVDGLAVDPVTHANVYAGIAGTGVLKTTTSGGSWSNTNIPLENVDAIALNRTTPTTLYAAAFGGGVFRSTDGAATWTALSGITDPLVMSLALDPGTPSIVYAGTATAGAWVSANGGATWTQLALAAGLVTAIAVDPKVNPSLTVYAGTLGSGIFKTTDGGATWNALASLPVPVIRGIVIDPASNVYVATGGGGVFASTDGGATWTTNGPAFPLVYSIAIDPTTPATLYAGTKGAGVFKTTNSGGAWSATGGTKQIANLNVFSLTVDPVTPTTVYAGTQGGGIFQSPDGGATWNAVNTGVNLGPGGFGGSFYQNPGAQLSEGKILDANGDNKLDLIVADSIHSPFTDNSSSLLQNTSGALNEVFGDYPNDFANVTARTSTMRALQVGGALDFTNAIYESAQASIANVAPLKRLPGQNPATFTPSPTGIPVFDQLGWIPQAVIAGNLDPPGTGATDLVIVHGVRQAGSAIQAGDVQGCVVVRLVDPVSKLLGAPFCLDPTDMGLLPSHAAIGDIDSASHTVAPFNFPSPAGSPDIIVANTGDASLTFYLHYQAGADPSPATYVSVNLPMSAVPLPAGVNVTFPPGDTIGVAIGDLNGDKANDFVVVGQLSKTAVFFIYDPDPAAPLSLLGVPQTFGLLPFRVGGVLNLPAIKAGRPRIADLTGDGRGEILIPSFLTNEVIVYVAGGPLGGTPTFTPVHYACDFQPFDVAVQDLNNDGRPDVAVVNQLSQDVSVFYQTSPGTLDEHFTPVPAGVAPFLMATGDVVGAGTPDVVCSMAGENTLWVFARSPALGLTPVKVYDLTNVSGIPMTNPVQPTLPFFPTVGDTTGTGRLDIVVPMEIVTDSFGNLGSGLDIMRGDPLGPGVAAVMTGSFGTIGFGAAVGDVNGDGIPDIVMTEYGSGGFTVFLGQPGGSFLRVPIGGVNASQPVVTDLDGDNKMDIVVGDGQSEVVVYYGPWTGVGNTTPPAPVVVPDGAINDSVSVVVADVNNDGMKDIIIGGFTSQSGGILFQTAPRVFQPVLLAVGGEPAQIAVGDLNGDGLPDIAMVWAQQNTLAIYYQNPNKTGLQDALLGPVQLATAAFPQGCVIVDVDGDGKNDVVVSCRGANALNIFFQR